jgi:hypothetical protein
MEMEYVEERWPVWVFCALLVQVTYQNNTGSTLRRDEVPSFVHASSD